MGFLHVFLGGNTRTGDAIRYMMDKIFSIENGSRPAVKKHMVLLTDGRSQVNIFVEKFFEKMLIFDQSYDNEFFRMMLEIQQNQQRISTLEHLQLV